MADSTVREVGAGAAIGDGPTLVLGRAGTGRTELIAARVAALAAGGARPDRISVLTQSAANQARLRDRVAELTSGSHEEVSIETWPGLAERLLRDYALEAGLDPFFQTASPADRLALLLDHLDDLPLRRHEIRGNPAGLLARLLERIDALKAEGIGPESVRDRARAAERGASGRSDRELALREVEFSELFDRHDQIMLRQGVLDEGELILELGRLLTRHSDLPAVIGERIEHLLVDELEDAGRPRIALLSLLAPHGRVLGACDPEQGLKVHRADGQAAAVNFRRVFPDASVSELPGGGRSRGPLGVVVGTAASLVPSSYRRALPQLTGPAAATNGQATGDAGEPEVRFWRCANERAQAQAAAREIEHLLAVGEARPAEICVVAGGGGRTSRLISGALEERNVPFRSAGSAAFFGRPEVRDTIAWLRAIADPNDSAAVVRALTRPPVELRSVDLARCTTIARRRKLDMISALEAALESPQLPPPSRDKLRGFLKLYRSAAAAFDGLRADVFVRRLIERIGFRRLNLFGASPETAERLVNLSRLSELAAGWTRRRPDGSTRDFVRYLAAVAEAGERFSRPAEPPPRDAVLLAEPEQVKGMEFKRVFVLGLDRGAMRWGAERAGWIPDELLHGDPPPVGDVADALRARRAYVATSRASQSLVLAYPEQERGVAVDPSQLYENAREALGAAEVFQEEELFGPAEGLHATYRMLRDEVLESSWRAGAALSEMRLDTAEDVNRSVARFLELVKLAALIQRPGEESARDALAGVNELLGRLATPEQVAELNKSALDDYVLDEGKERTQRSEQSASRAEPGLEEFLPSRGGGLALSASDVDLYLTCPLKYKFARVFAIPQDPTINQRFGILVHNVLERYHAEELRGSGSPADGGLDRLLSLFEAGWRRTGFGFTDDELQYRDRAVAALARYYERDAAGGSRPVWLERRFSFKIGDNTVSGRIDRVDRHPDGNYELIDYKTGAPKTEEQLAGDLQIALYRIAVRESWGIEADDGSYWYVLDDEKVRVAGEPGALERVERTVEEVSQGITGQDFEPRPSFESCSWCDFRLICPAAEA